MRLGDVVLSYLRTLVTLECLIFHLTLKLPAVLVHIYLISAMSRCYGDTCAYSIYSIGMPSSTLYPAYAATDYIDIAHMH